MKENEDNVNEKLNNEGLKNNEGLSNTFEKINDEKAVIDENETTTDKIKELQNKLEENQATINALQKKETEKTEESNDEKTSNEQKRAKEEKEKTGGLPLFKQAILLVVIMACVYVLSTHYYELWKQKKLIAEANEAYKNAVSTAVPTATPAPTPEKTLEPTPKSTPLVVRPEYKALMEKYNNQDIVGYLNIPDTTIDYPIVKSTDNEYYLHYDIANQPSSAGWPYLDYENDVSKSDKNSIIYGHNMKSETMFHDLRKYVSEDFYKDHKYIYFDSLYENRVYEIFSFYRTDTNFYYIQVHFPIIDEFKNLLDEINKKSLYDTGIDVTVEDKILTLSTCTNEREDTRFVACARLLSDDEIKEKGIVRP